MPEYNYEFRGWHAAIALVAVLGFFGVKSFLRIRMVDESMRDAVRQQLMNEYSGRGPKDVARLVAEARAQQPLDAVPPLVQRDIEFKSIGARGQWDALVAVIRVEITVDGAAPPDGRNTRFFRVSQKLDGGWMVIGDSDSYSYFMMLVPW